MSKKIFIAGGSGNIGKRLATQAIARGHTALSMHRSPEQADDLRLLGASPVAGDLVKHDVDELAGLMSGADVVVFTAGAGGKGGAEMTNAIDGKGLEKSVDAARKAGIKRFLLVSAFPESGRGRTVSETFENYMKVKKAADVYLANTDLDWVIVRPGTLTNDEGTGMINAGLAIPYGNVPRDDVAATLLEVIDTPKINRVIIELTEGEFPVTELASHIG